ncbi:hypothetical protein QJS10_CPB17g01317 [Acorus calamus]|uniref:Heparan-alpha-glucosaminide N-acetyltransferase n=1 Tax=Acorus calamus TaxID=4465 RepID=A0AAV9CVH6_ACOCL|nr:hypothetical protein QJS10_CPB17g01317 [Acorus calamus]
MDKQTIMEGEEDIDQKHHQHRLIIEEGPPPETRSSTLDDADDKQPPPPPKTKRVASLDIFRGLTVAMMVLVDGAGGEWPAIGHAPWEGCNLADFVMPFFLFIVGMAVPLSLKRIPNRLLAAKRVVLRTAKLIFWGLLLQGGYSHAPDELTYGVDMKQIRWCGILQFSFELFRLAGACILIVYLAMLYGMYVPNWEFTVHNSNSKDYGKVLTACTDVSPHEGPIRADAPSWCQAPFEPEGILRVTRKD